MGCIHSCSRRSGSFATLNDPNKDQTAKYTVPSLPNPVDSEDVIDGPDNDDVNGAVRFTAVTQGSALPNGSSTMHEEATDTASAAASELPSVPPVTQSVDRDATAKTAAIDSRQQRLLFQPRSRAPISLGALPEEDIPPVATLSKITESLAETVEQTYALY